MASFSSWVHQVTGAQQALSGLMQDSTDPAQVASALESYQELLASGAVFAENSEPYGVFLREQLDWLQQQIVLIEAQKASAAAELLQLERRKKAKQGYDKNT